MKKLYLRLFCWLRNLFNVSNPEILSLEYVDCVFDNSAYLLIQWHFRNAYRLNIKKLNYQSFNKQASAYIILPNGFTEIEVSISNVWRSEKRKLKLSETTFPEQLNYPVNTNFKKIDVSHVHIVDVKLKMEAIKMKKIKLGVKKLTKHLNIMNLNYSSSNE